MICSKGTASAAALLLGVCLVSAAFADAGSAAAAVGRQDQLSSWRRQLSSDGIQARQLLHAGIDHGSEEEEAAHDETTATTDAATANAGDGRSYTWLKWVSVAVLFVEGMVGVLLPVLLKMTVRPGWLLSVVNCFAGGVFFSFGVLHLAPDAINAQQVAGFDRFPLAAFLVAIAFYTVFFLHRILAPALRLSPHMHDYPMAMGCPKKAAARATADKSHMVTLPFPAGDYQSATDVEQAKAGVAECPQCKDACGCNGGAEAGKEAGSCGNGCQAGACICEHKSVDSESSSGSEDVKGFGTTAATVAKTAKAPLRVQEGASGKPGWLLRAAALLSPVLILFGILCHTVLEGLAIGLQNSYADVVSAVVAMVSHKWVESVALAAAFLAAGSSMLTVVAFLIPFSLGPLVGLAIGVSVDNTNVWVVLVLFALVAGLFIYVGSVGIVAEEFAKYDDPAFAATRPRGARFYLMAAMFFGFTVVALLQLVPSD